MPPTEDVTAAPTPLPPPPGVRLVTLPEHPCPYLPNRDAQNRAFLASVLDPGIYHQLMDAGFRRSGQLVYQPICRTCRACTPIRVPTARFTPSKSQRRCWRRNQDLIVGVDPPSPTEEKFEIYQRYVTQRHRPDADAADRDSFCQFLYNSPVQSLEFTYRDRCGRLLAVGLCDVSPKFLSSVYFYFDPDDSRRGLGTFGALYEINFARRNRIPHYYLGYWVGGCATMEYKAQFRPNELLGPDGIWRENRAPQNS